MMYQPNQSKRHSQSKQRYMSKLMLAILSMLVFNLATFRSCDADLLDVFLEGLSQSVSETQSEIPTIEEQVLLDQDGVKVTATEYIHDSLWGDQIKVLIENNSSKNMGVICDALIVNNYMFNDFFSETVAAGKKSYETLDISSTSRKEAGIDHIGQVEVCLHLFDGDTYSTISTASCATIKTSDFDKMETLPHDEGQEIYNQGGIRIVAMDQTESSLFGKNIPLFIQNNSGRNVTIHSRDLSVNGFMVSDIFSSTVYDGKMIVDEITLLSSDLEESGITEIKDVELSFHIFDEKTWDTITDTAPIKFSIN